MPEEEPLKKQKSSWGTAAIAITTIGIVVAAILMFKGNCPCNPPGEQASVQTATPGACCSGTVQKPPEKPAQQAADSIDAAKANVKIPRLVDLGAGKCIPCKAMAPILEDLKKSYEGKLAVEFIDVWERQDEAAKYRISMIPTQIFFDADGKELFRHEGFFSKDEILAKCKELGYNL
jgi:thioredoxin 1